MWCRFEPVEKTEVEKSKEDKDQEAEVVKDEIKLFDIVSINQKKFLCKRNTGSTSSERAVRFKEYMRFKMSEDEESKHKDSGKENGNND